MTVNTAYVLMLSYFKLYVWLLFPPAAVLLALLLAPLPHGARRAVVTLTDTVLFSRPHPHVPLSLFWCVLILSLLTFLLVADDMREVNRLYREARGEGRVTELRIKLLAEERNAWISACCLTLWVVVHRYRNLLKKYYAVSDENERLMGELALAKSVQNRGPAPVVVVAQPSNGKNEKCATMPVERPTETEEEEDGIMVVDPQTKKNE